MCIESEPKRVVDHNIETGRNHEAEEETKEPQQFRQPIREASTVKAAHLE